MRGETISNEACSAAIFFDCLRIDRDSSTPKAPLSDFLDEDVASVTDFLTRAETDIYLQQAAYQAMLLQNLCQKEVSREDFITQIRILKYKLAYRYPEHYEQLRDFCISLSRITAAMA